MNLRTAMAVLLVAPAVGLAAPSGDAPRGAAAPGSEPQRPPVVRMTPDAAAKIPDPEKLDVSQQKLKEIKKSVERVTGHSDQARKEKDVGKLNCLNLQLTQMRALQKVAQLANDALVDAVGKKDPATASTHFARVVIAAEKVQRMGGEADICLGQLAFLLDGKTRVDMDQPEGLPARDVTARKPVEAPFEAPPIVRPLAASRYY